MQQARKLLQLIPPHFPALRKQVMDTLIRVKGEEQARVNLLFKHNSLARLIMTCMRDRAFSWVRCMQEQIAV
jgi:hypothetical protein